MLWLFFRNQEWDKLRDSLLDVQPLWIVPGIVVYFAGIWLRGIRWRLLMLPFAKVPESRLASVILIGFTVNNVLPLRLGELVRTFVLRRSHGVPIPATLATILIERVLDIAVDSADTREFVYQLDDDSFGISEILAIDGNSFLVLERDGKAGNEARCKKIMRAGWNEGTTDVRNIGQLPPGPDLPAGVRPLTKSLLIDLLDPAYGISGALAPEKFEGLAFGPTLPDGRRLLLVCVDNDFLTEQPSWFYAFAIAPELLPGFAWRH